MIKNDPKIQSLISQNIIERISEEYDVNEKDAKKALSSMSFGEYYQLIEQPVVPPSGQTIGGTTSTVQPQKSPAATKTPAQDKEEKVIGWTGTGPIKPGVTVGLQQKNVPTATPAAVTNVDNKNKTITVMDPTTNTSSVYSETDPRIKPFMVKQTPGAKPTGTQGQPAIQSGTTTPTTESSELRRLKELAGIMETCSAGATGAGNVAVAIGETGSMIRRQTTTEKRWAKEYKGPDMAPTSVIGDTKPNQASKKLSADLVANNKVSANRGRKIKR